MALTHEIESYLGHSELESFIKRAYDMLAPQGTYINYGVVGPDEPTRKIHTLLTSDDGINPDDLRWELEGPELTAFLSSLSTYSRFERFVKDFRADEGDGISIDHEGIKGQTYVVSTFADMCEFLAKKDYVDS